MYNVYTVLVELTVLYSGHLPNLLGSLHCTVVSTSTNIYKNLSVFRQKRGCEDSPEDRDPAATLQAMAGTLYHSILPEGAVGLCPWVRLSARSFLARGDLRGDRLAEIALVNTVQIK